MPERQPSLFSSGSTASIHAAAMDFAYKKGLRDGAQKARALAREDLLGQISLWVRSEEILAVGLSQVSAQDDLGARIGLLVRLQEIVGRIDGLTEPLLAASKHDAAWDR